MDDHHQDDDELAHQYIGVNHRNGQCEVQKSDDSDRKEKEWSFSDVFLDNCQADDYECELDAVDDDWSLVSELRVELIDEETALSSDRIASTEMSDHA